MELINRIVSKSVERSSPWFADEFENKITHSESHNGQQLKIRRIIVIIGQVVSWRAAPSFFGAVN